ASVGASRVQLSPPVRNLSSADPERAAGTNFVSSTCPKPQPAGSVAGVAEFSIQESRNAPLRRSGCPFPSERLHEMRTLPDGPVRAPCFAALVASSWIARPTY